MNIDQLPDDALLQVFRFLPLKEQIRIGRVNKLFHRASELAIAEFKDFKCQVFRYASVDSVRRILQLCSSRLAKVEFDTEDGHLLKQLARFPCPNLLELEIHHTPLDNGTFGQLMRYNPNLKRLICCFLDYDSNICLTFPNDVIRMNLETLVCGLCRKESLLSITGRFPNLKNLKMCLAGELNESSVQNFFASCPNIELLIIDMEETDFHILDGADSFWRLPLRTLNMYIERNRFASAGDAIAAKIAISFPNLQVLHLTMRLSNAAVSSLAVLRNLMEVSLSSVSASDFDYGLRKFSQCGQLRKLRINGGIQPETLIRLVNRCGRLQYLDILRIREVQTAPMAAEIARSFNGFGSKDLVITLLGQHAARIWQSRAVRNVLEKLNETENRMIKFKEGDSFWQMPIEF